MSRVASLLLLVLAGCPETTPPTDAPLPAEDTEVIAAEDSEPPSETDAASPSDTETPSAPTCTAYCEAMASVCPEEAFHHQQACPVWCEGSTTAVPIGTLQDTSTDTLGCRMNHIAQAEAATTDAERTSHCASASASGGDVCGTWCDTYCRQGIATCSAANQDYPRNQPLYFEATAGAAPLDQCLADCQQLPTDVLDGVSQTDQHFGYGDTVQCRLHHQQAAMVQGVTEGPNAFALHCGHGALEPTELCTDATPPNHINYCEFAVPFCPDLFEAGTTTTECRGLITDLVDRGVYAEGPFRSFTDQDRNSLGCLNYWITLSPTDPSACAKADWDPDHWTTVGGSGMCARRP